MKWKTYTLLMLTTCLLFAARQQAFASDEDFETGDFSSFPWTQFPGFPAVPAWYVDSTPPWIPNGGSYSATCDGSSEGDLSVTLDCPESGYIGFWFSTWSGSQGLSFLIDGVDQGELDPVGTSDEEWVFFPREVLPGSHTYTWRASGMSPGNTYFLDNITFPSIDETPPDPDPMTWDTEPYATSVSSIRMVATTASDEHGVMYYFEETSGNPGGEDSGWQDSPIYEDTGLDAGTSYSYGVKAHDEAIAQNETAYSVIRTANTFTPPVNPPTVGNGGGATNIYYTGEPLGWAATLRGEVTDTGGEDPIVTIFYGDTDWGTNLSMWGFEGSQGMGQQSGAFSFDVDGLESDTTYYYRCFATNSVGSDWADSTESFTTGASANNAPTDIGLSNSSVSENQPSGTTVGTLSTTDPDAGNTFTYALVAGSGDSDNASFTTNGSALQTAEVFDYETKNSYSIRMRTTDQGGLWYEEAFTISVTDVFESSVPPPSSFQATAASSSQVDLLWTKNASNDNVMLAYNTSNSFGTPIDGTSYSVGGMIGSATVLYSGSAIGFSQTNLNAGTSYYYRAWSVNGSTEYSTGVDANALTHSAPVPFHFFDGFESGGLSAYWSTYSTGLGRIRVLTSDSPYAGTYHVCMDRSSDGSYDLNELVLSLDLTGKTNVFLNFWHKEFNDEDNAMSATFSGHENADGVAISVDGSTWYKAQGLIASDGISSVYKEFTVSLDPILASHGLSYGAGFKIKFQQYDNYAMTTDGFAFDNISVYVPSLEISTAALPTGMVVSPYLTTLEAANGTPPYTWSIDSGSLQAGLALSSGGIISGTPTGFGTNQIVFAVQDDTGSSTNKLLELVVLPQSVDHFTWEPIGSTQYVGHAFPVNITAMDVNSNVVTGFTNTIGLAGSDANIPISPTNTGSFVSGAWTGTVTVSELATNMVLQADDGNGHTGDSNPFNVEPLPLLTVSVPDAATEGDGIVTGEVSLIVAPVSNLVVDLASDDISEATVPSSVTILAGETNATFDVQIENDTDLDGSQSATITASAFMYQDGEDSIIVHDNEIATLGVVLPSSVTEGSGVVTGEVTVSATVATNVVVALASDNPSEATVPSSVIVLAGETNAFFDVTIHEDTLIDGSQPVSITAHVENWIDGSNTITVVDNEHTNLVVSLPVSATEGDGTLAAAGSVSISGTLPTDLSVSLLSDDTTEASVTSQVTIVAGSTSTTFDVEIVDDSIMDGVQTARVTAAAAGFADGSDIISVQDNDGEIRGSKWHDINTNAIWDAGEPGLQGWKIYSDLNGNQQWDAGEPFDTTDANGDYSFVAAAGSHSVAEESQTYWEQTYPSGSGGGSSYSNSLVQYNNCYSPNVLNFHFPDALPPVGDGALTVYADADLDLTSEYLILSSEGTSLGNIFVTGGLQNSPVTTTVDIDKALLEVAATDGIISFTVTPSSDVGNLGSTELRLALTYPVAGGTHAIDLIAGNIATNINFGNATTGLVLNVSVPDLATEGDGVVTGLVTATAVPFSNLVVNLTSDNISEATAPTTITMLAGQTNATFDLQIVDDGDLDGTQGATITASAFMYQDGSDFIIVHDNETATLGVVLPTDASEGAGIVTGQVTVSATVATNVVVALGSDNPSEATVPSSVIVLAGETNAFFDITIYEDTDIDGTQPVVISAHVENWIDGSNTIAVLDNEHTNLIVSLPASATEGNGTLADVGSVSISGTLPVDLLVSLVSDDTTEAIVTSLVTIVAGSTSATFAVVIVDDSIMDGVQTAMVTASASGFAPGSDTIEIADNDVHHYTFSAIASPQTASQSFTTTIVAHDVNGVQIPSYAGMAGLSAAGDGGAMFVTPSNTTSFAGGQWTGSVAVDGVDSNVRLVADDGMGHTGTSTVFNVVAGPLDHFTWESVATTQYVGGAFPVSIMARDANTNVVTEFTSSVALNGLPNDYGVGFSNSFDTVTAPALPTGWTVSHTGAGSAWSTTTAQRDTSPNAAFAPDPSAMCDSKLTSPTIFVSGGDGQLSFRHSYATESGWDGGVLEISIGGGSFLDILSAGGSFSAGGYNRTLNSTGTNPLKGRQAWSGSSAGFITTTVSLPSMASGQNVQFRWRFGSDGSMGSTGWYVDTVVVDSLTMMPVSINRTNTDNFTNGVWIGSVAVLQLATNMYLQADDGSGHTGDSNPFNVEPMPLLAVSLLDAASEGDGVVTGIVTTTLAPASNLVVNLVSDDISEATVPVSVTILAGQTNALFDVQIENDTDLDGSQSATITASAFMYQDGEDSIIVHDNEIATLGVVLPTDASEGAGIVTGQVTVSATVATNVVVTLASDDLSEATVPANVTVLAGQTSALFDVTIHEDTLIDGTQPVLISAHVENWIDGSNTIAVLDNEHTNLVVSLPASATEGDGTLADAGSVSISGTLPVDLLVSLVSDDTTEATVTSLVTIAAGSTSATFDVDVVDDVATDGVQTAMVTASASGFASGSDTLEINDNDVHHFSFNAISSPQTASELFAVTIEAYDVNGLQIPSYTGTAGLSALGDGGAMEVSPSNTTAFTGGQWSGSASVHGVDSNVVLIADDGMGHTGTSTVFNVVSGPLDHFTWASIAPTQYVGHAFPVAITARDANTNVVTSFTNTVDLTGIVGSSVDTVEILTFTLYADMDQEYLHTLTALSSHFENYNETSTTVTSASALEAALVGKNVFLIVEQETSGSGDLEALGTAWATVLNDFVTGGGIVIACSYSKTEHTILSNSGLMSLNKSGSDSSLLVDRVGSHRLVNDVASSFTDPYVSKYGSTDGTVVLETSVDKQAVVAYRDVGAGHAVMIGTDYYTTGTDMDRILANAVQWAESGGIAPISIAPTNTSNFVAGVWTGSVTVQEVATNMYLHADDGSGHAGDSIPFDVEMSPPLSVTVPSITTEGDGVVTGEVAVSVAPASNLVVSLTSDDISEATVPSSVTILAGETNAPFDVQIVNDTDLDGSQTATITASTFMYQDGSVSIIVHDNETATLGVVLPSSVAEDAGVVTGQVTVSATVATDVLVALASDDLSEATVLSNIVVLAGQSSALFNVTIHEDTLIDGTQPVLISAHVENWIDGSNTISVLDNEHTNLVVTLPVSATEGDGTLADAGSVSISGTLPSDLPISLISDDTTEATVTSLVTIVAGATSATFDVGIVDDSIMDGVQTAQVTAAASGFADGFDIVSVQDNDGEIRGSKWHDINTNEIWDVGEPGLQGWKIYVDLDANEQWDAGEPFDTTDANGDYSLVMESGQYFVAEEPQPYWTQSYPSDSEGIIELTFKQVLKDGVDGVDGLSNGGFVTISPDGRHVYAAGRYDDAVAVFSRDSSSGQLSFVQMVKDGIGGVNGLDWPNSIAVSPDGNNVYVAGMDDDAVAVFSRNLSSGQLSFIQMMQDGMGGVDGLDSVRSVAVSPDGSHVYTAGAGDDAVAVFSRNPSSGQLTFVQMVQNGVGGVYGLDYPVKVTVSPDGGNVYAIGLDDDAVVVFSRNPSTGQLSYVHKVEDGVGGVDGLGHPSAVTVSPDGGNVYVSGWGDDAVAVFSRNPSSGWLSFVQVVKDGVGGVDGLESVTSVTVSPDGGHVYTASWEDKVAVFSRDPSSGHLTYLHMVQDEVGGVDGLNKAESVTVSPDSQHVYVISADDDAVAVFSRGELIQGKHVVNVDAGQIVTNINFGNVSGDIPDHFAWESIAPTQYIGYAFIATITARDANTNVLTTYEYPVGLTASDGSIPFNPTNTDNFVAGEWTGLITVHDPAANMYLRADDGNGHTGDSNPFSVLAIPPFVDSDGDGVPDWWENLHSLDPYVHDSSTLCSNGVNTVLEAYIAGLHPAYPDTYFVLSGYGNELWWNSVSGRVYGVWWSSNLLNGFQPLETNLPWTPAAYTDTVHTAEDKGFYKLDVKME